MTTAFTAAATASLPWLRSVARRLAPRFRGDYDAEDLVQSGLLRAWRDFARRDPARCTSARVWLRQRALHGMQDAVRRMSRPWDPGRKRTRRYQLAGELALLTVAAEAREADRLAARGWIAWRLSRLTRRQRRLVQMLMDGWPMTEIARVLECTERNAYLMRASALRRLAA